MSEKGAIPTIHRIHKSGNFTILPNSLLNNNKISSKAKGIMAVMLSLPGDRAPAREQLRSRIKEGPNAIRSAMRELVTFRYAHYMWAKDERGRFTSGYVLYEDPSLNPHPTSLPPKKMTSKSIERDGGLPNAENQHTVGTEWGYGLDAWIDVLRNKGCNPREKSSGVWEAHCPCHDDRKASLSVGRGTIRPVVAYCHAGCSFEALVQYLFPGSNELPAVYTYADAMDKALYRICRSAKGKEFFAQSFRGGKWVSRLGQEVERVPYRLREVVRAIAQRERVWIVEGEKDVETMRRKGLVATCNPFGAGEWKFPLNVWFKDAILTIVADKDEAGVKHALSIEEQLRPIAASIRLVQAAGDDSINDATDHFEAGYGIGDFEALRVPEMAGAGV